MKNSSNSNNVVKEGKRVRKVKRNIHLVIGVIILVCALFCFILALKNSEGLNKREIISGEGSNNQDDLSSYASQSADSSDQLVDNSSPDSEKERTLADIESGDVLQYQINTDIEISTPYCTLHYPQEWSDNLKIVTSETEDIYRVYFIGLIENDEVPLFAISFGESSEMLLGTLQQEDGASIAIHLNLELFSVDDGWSDPVSEIATQMVSDSSYTIEELSLLDTFS